MDTESKREYEKKIVSEMIALYCSRNHNMKQGKMCEKCDELNRYARTRSATDGFLSSGYGDKAFDREPEGEAQAG